MHDLDDALCTLAHLGHQASDKERLLDDFAGSLAEALGADLLQVLELDTEGRDFLLVAGRGFAPDLYGTARIPGGLYSQAGRAALDPLGEPVVLEDFSAPHDWYLDPLLENRSARSGVAIKVPPEARAFGALGVFYQEPRRFQPEVLSFISTAASILGAAIDRLYERATAEAWHSRAELLRTGASLARIPAERDELMRAAALTAVSGGMDGARPMADWCFADVPVVGGSRHELKRVAVDHAQGCPEHIKDCFSTPLLPTTPHGAPRVIHTRQPELVARTGPEFRAAIARDHDHLRAIEQTRPYSYLCVPVCGCQRLYGALGFLRVETGIDLAYEEADLAACFEFAALVGAAIDLGTPKPDIQEARDAVASGVASNNAHHSSPTGSPTGSPSVSELAARAVERIGDRERAVLHCLARGLSMQQIATELHMGYSTVKTHRLHTRQKLGLDKHAPDVLLVNEARRRGWIPA